MATQIEQILGKDINSLKELREEIKRLQDSIAAIDPATQEFKDTTVKLTAAQEQLTAVTRAGKDGNDAAKDSIVGMEREYKSLYNTYKMLTEEQRNSNFGKEMAASLNTLSTKLNETKKGVGNFKDNIGRYSESVIDAFSKMGGSVGGLVGPFATATKGVMGFNAALKANPVGAVITLIMTLINAVKALKESIQGNEESQMRWNQAMASFQPIVDAVKNAMDRFAQTILSVVEFIAKVVDKIRVAKAAFTDFLGITKGAKDAVKEQQKTYKELAKSVNDLTKTKREAQKQNAADEAEVQRLREEASETTNLVEKKELLQQAKDKQAEIDQRNIDIAKEELRILEEQSKLTSNSAADNEKLAAAVAKVAEAEATAANNARAFNKQLGNGSTATTTITTATKNYREEAKKLYEELVEENKTEIQKLTEKYEKEKKLLEKYHLDTKLLTQKFEKDRQKIIYESYENIRSRMATEYQLQQDLLERRKQAIGDDFLITAADIQETYKKIYELEQIEIHLEDAFDDWSQNFWSSQEGNIKRYGEEWKEEAESVFKDLFKPGTNWENNMDEALKRAKELFEKASLITGENIIDIESVRLYIRIFQNELNKLNDEAFNKRLSFDLNENLLNYYSQLTALLKQERDGNYQDMEETNLKIAELGYEELEKRKEILEQAAKDENLSIETRLSAQQQYYEALNEMRERNTALNELYAERDKKAWSDSIEAVASIGSSLGNISQSYETVINAKLKDGRITKEQADKQKKSLADLEKVTKWVNIASVVGSTTAGIMGIWKAYGLEKAANAETAAAAGPAAAGVLAALNTKSLISAIAQTAGLAATGIAQVASINANSISRVQALTDTGNSGGAAGTAATPMEIDSTPYTYTRTLQTADEEDELNRPVWVSVEDISSAIGKRARVSDESSF